MLNENSLCDQDVRRPEKLWTPSKVIWEIEQKVYKLGSAGFHSGNFRKHDLLSVGRKVLTIAD